MTADPSADYQPNPSNWTGWVVFGAAMIMLAGAFNVIQGLVALLDDGYLLTTPAGLTVDVSYTTYGWVQIGLGALSILIGIGMMVGVAAALVAGVIIAVVSAIVHMGMIAAYPAWSLIVIAFDVIVIYSIVTHGTELRSLRRNRAPAYVGEEAYIARAR